ncbi:MAG: hypothetical protein QOI98_1685 [Solirubrobacteraceae bacterium]|nr:hypothetical protein [Solirubrobacteraceae bacterium]
MPTSLRPDIRATAIAAVLAAVLALGGAAPASADFFPGETIDGPSGEVVRLGDVDVARDGTGAVVYVKRDGGTDHVFVSRLVGGAFRGPERVDVGLDAAGAQPVVAASDGGRLAIAFVNGGTLFAVVAHNAGEGLPGPQALADGASNPSIDMSINGGGYISFTGPGGSNLDVRSAHLERDSTTFTVLGQSLDVDPSRAAGEGAVKRSRVVVSADGTGLVTWGEDGADGRTHVMARRVFGANVSSLPQDITLDSLNGAAGGGADSPDLDIEDDSSFAWVVFRQSFAVGAATLTSGPTAQSRTIARRLVGSQFEAPVVVDGLGPGVTEGADAPRIDLNGLGQGLAVSETQTSHQVFGSVLDQDVFGASQRITASPNGIDPLPQPTVSQSGDGVVAWLQSGGPTDPAVVHARRVTKLGAGPEAELSPSNLGGVDASLGFDSAADRGGDTVVAYVQGAGGDRRIMAATYDRPPASFVGFTTSKPRPAEPLLKWGSAFELWGVTYRVEVDGVVVGTTPLTRLKLSKVASGTHRWRVVAVDRHGQQTATPTRILRVDGLAPRLKVTISGRRRHGKVVRFSLRASDPKGKITTGLKGTRIDFGDGAAPSTLRRVAHVYRHAGTYAVEVLARDKAGNETIVSRAVRIK